ncbi:putative DNA binding domain-containing protein [Acinetobacter towneri]|uniref:RNA-binding domain-containing protein n=1 Tax=Acinetobacter TaxID=469 RepID=UPI000CF27321|nr:MULTISPECIES: RNA-binding domain-containing protein [Acinetobacter]AVH48860.1 transcriptional regulator [Acinetobacter sp. SWBY1]MCA4778380.1 putative DNA binding domain-containing protein [Acinetobacter towneri]MCA4783708.1 putative DNA binding domain-containing protein [Acinetobacter towneri]MCA4786943.1 putative DNA binding domain-containing protein [Acinetobacter towneri]MCA4795045.1 putative DNA binding domain-containing protein [Acinetobacter towneri]
MTEYIKNLVQQLVNEPNEQEWLEFKENYHSAEEIGERISALANGACLCNKRNGYLIFGVKDSDQSIVGTNFDPKKQKAKGNEDLEFWLSSRLNPRLDFKIYDVEIDGKKVIVFEIPATSHTPVTFLHEAYIRVGSITKKLKDYPEKAKKIWQSMSTDWSAEICQDATIEDLDPIAIAKARQLFIRKNPRLAEEVPNWDDVTFLNKARLTIKGKITNTAIVLLGLPESAHFINPAVAQITWILKSADGIEKDYEHFYTPFLLAVDEVYHKIRNLKYRYLMSGTLFPEEVDQYDPYIIREALSNAIAHQDYRLGGRITIVEKEDSTLTFQNYGSFLPVSIEHVILSDSPEQKYRNTFLVNAMMQLNLIDTIGSGIRRMFLKQREKFFPMPDYDLENNRVQVKITGKVLNMDYARKLAELPDLSLSNIIALDQVQKNLPIQDTDASELRKKGLIEGRKPNFCISANVAEQTDLQAEYLDMRGLDDQHYQGLILEYLKKFGQAKRAELEKLLVDKLPQVLDQDKKINRIRNLMQKMRVNGLIETEGKTWKIAKK